MNDLLDCLSVASDFYYCIKFTSAASDISSVASNVSSVASDGSSIVSDGSSVASDGLFVVSDGLSVVSDGSSVANQHPQHYTDTLKTSTNEDRQFTLKFSAMEIYNEVVKNLLILDDTPLRLLDDPERGTVVEKLTECFRQVNITSIVTILAAQRKIGETALNEVSSRSHQILRLTVEGTAKKIVILQNASTLTAAVNFVDLAGTANVRMKEGSHINRSLLTLGTVIRKLRLPHNYS
ncbi:Kinesin-like protein NACK2 [Capsicum baccatum]|uniref:Kinesin-like protein NACK2 n=1 Tax=Capsicum baccatum TaxID=33114 RepID=A0A2G2VTE3_CAPBA|nr:Kinesin-like protein NACK2 [Capsicum baccatum]